MVERPVLLKARVGLQTGYIAGKEIAVLDMSAIATGKDILALVNIDDFYITELHGL